LSPAAEKAVKSGHPWVFSESVRDLNREGSAGELAVVYGREDKFLAIGLYDPASPIRVRILHTGKPVTIDAVWWRERMTAALAKREGMFTTDTKGYRLINGESDGWPGLVLDRYAGTLVLKLYSAVWLPRLEEILALIVNAVPSAGVVLRLSRNITEVALKEFGVSEGVIRGESEETVVFTENGLRFESEVLKGQKTGFFLDQRDNRRRVGELTSGAEVLNAFSFSGGFSLYAARGGAKRVLDIDISQHALAAGDRNFALNQHIPAVRSCRRDTVHADAFQWLAEGQSEFDMVIVDPPSLAKREADRAGAIVAYERLAASALLRLKRGGVLVAASCSAHVSMEEFLGAVRRAVRGYATRELWTAGHAPDHAVTFREAEYLKCLALRYT
jgi:23S rRNA (cytosine1962-C5)-methyltransferase